MYDDIDANYLFARRRHVQEILATLTDEDTLTRLGVEGELAKIDEELAKRIDFTLKEHRVLHIYPCEIEAATKAMRERREQLIAKPLARIYDELAIAALTAAAEARARHMSRELDKMVSGITPENRHQEL